MDKKKRKKGLTPVRLHGTIVAAIPVLNPVNVVDDEPCVLTAQIAFHGDGGPDHALYFIPECLNDSVTIEIIG